MKRNLQRIVMLIDGIKMTNQLAWLNWFLMKSKNAIVKRSIVSIQNGQVQQDQAGNLCNHVATDNDVFVTVTVAGEKKKKYCVRFDKWAPHARHYTTTIGR